MINRLGGLLALVVVLALPFLLRPRERLLDRSGEPLVIVTPHNEAIRFEFARAFRLHMRVKTGRKVSVDWRTPGGTNEIARYVASEYAAAFENYWTGTLRRTWTPAVAAAFANPSVRWRDPPEDDAKIARRSFLESDVGIGIDLMFGGGTPTHVAQAASGWLVDSGRPKSQPEAGIDTAIPEMLGSTRFRDAEGRWVGTCLSGFGICFNKDAIRRAGLDADPTRWKDLADPRLLGQLALADPSKSGTAAVSFEMVVQEQMNQREDELAGTSPPGGADLEAQARREGWDRAMRLIRCFGANARYFSDAAPKIAIDIANGDAAAGMCIDFYGRFQSESTPGGASRMGFNMPRGGSALTADPIALLRGAPHRELALEFIDFVLSIEGQKLWDFKVGAPGGPERYALRRLPILAELERPEFRAWRSDPDERAYDQIRSFRYHPSWTGPLLRTISFVVRVMCIDTQDDLATAYRALARAGFPARASAVFDDVGLVDYAAASGPIRQVLDSSSAIDEVVLANRLTTSLREQYHRVTELARSGDP